MDESREEGSGVRLAGKRLTTGRGKHRTRRLWISVVSVAAIVGLIALMAYVTQPPKPPFERLWSVSLDGNPNGVGATSNGTFVTFASHASPVSTQGNYVKNVSVSMVAINVTSGVAVWSSQPLILHGVTTYFPQVQVSWPFAYLLVNSATLSGGNLSVLCADVATGNPEGSWAMPLPDWSAILAPTEELAVSGSEMVVAYPLALQNPLTIVTLGVNGLTGHVGWRTSLQFNGSGGWGTGSASLEASGSLAVLQLNVASTPARESILSLDFSDGSILVEKNYSQPVGLSGVIIRGMYYIANNSSGAMYLQGLNLFTGGSGPNILVTNVADEELFSIDVFGAGPDLIVASYSPSLSYAAYSVNGSELWVTRLPYSPSCGPVPNYPALGPCATLLGPPLLYGEGSDVLLSSVASGLVQGSNYYNTYRLVNLSTGEVVWNSDYIFTYGVSWPWYGPVPSFTVNAVVGPVILYVTQTPGGTSTSGGLL